MRCETPRAVAISADDSPLRCMRQTVKSRDFARSIAWTATRSESVSGKSSPASIVSRRARGSPPATSKRHSMSGRRCRGRIGTRRPVAYVRGDLPLKRDRHIPVDASDETTPRSRQLQAADTGLAANLMYCGHSFLSDGKLLAIGGGGAGAGQATSVEAWKFDPVAETWQKTASDMAIKRWYPTVVTLGDELGPTGRSGRVLVASGDPGAATPTSIEVYSEASPLASTTSARSSNCASTSQLVVSRTWTRGWRRHEANAHFGAKVVAAPPMTFAVPRRTSSALTTDAAQGARGTPMRVNGALSRFATSPERSRGRSADEGSADRPRQLLLWRRHP